MRNERLNSLLCNITDTDSYKFSHWLQDPPGTTHSSFYLSSRGGRYGNTVFYGLQPILHEYLSAPITLEQIDYAAGACAKHGEPFNRDGWIQVLERHGGNLPVRIKAVKEGTILPTHNAMLTTESTDEQLSWVAGHIETQLVRLWYPITVCTLSYHVKKKIYEYLLKTADKPLAELNFKLHDFGGRGATCREAAGIGGSAHLVNFLGSDTFAGVMYANEFYSEEMSAFSIPAAEHSTVCKWGRGGERDFYRHMFKTFGKKDALWACVSDTYDLYDVMENVWGDELRDEIEKSGSTVVARPDSGVPHEVVLKCLQILERKVGAPKNMVGYKVLPKWLRLIQGDGVNEDSIEEILATMEHHGYSASNIAFGMGGALLQKIDRDTQRFAYKCWEATVNGEVRAISKDPKTDPGKRSLAGVHSLVMRDGKFETVPGEVPGNQLETVFENGKILRHQTLADVRKLAWREFA